MNIAKAIHFVSLLTLDEKAWLITGVAGPCIGDIGPILEKSLQFSDRRARTANYYMPIFLYAGYSLSHNKPS